MPAVTMATDNATGIADAVTKISYPSPFFDLARKYLPLNIKELFSWTNYFYAISSVVHPIVNRLSEYPVTDLVYGNIDSSAKKAWQKILEQSIDIKTFMIESHIDWFVYGNAFALFHEPFIRYLVCEKCGTRKQAKTLKYRFVAQAGTWHLTGNCDKCGTHNTKFKVDDILVRDRTRAKLTRISPLQIEIEYNEFNGECEYIYKIPSTLKKAVFASSKIVLDTIDTVVLDAVTTNKDVRLDKDRIFHFKRYTMSGLWKGWGTPALLPVIKDIHYYHILRKANEALAVQRIVPLSVLFPSQQGDVSPFQHLNLSGWRGKVEDELGKWRRDSNYVPIMPIPLGYQMIFGEAKQLMVTQEQDLCARGIAAGLGVPIEFIQGGLNWTGSSISLRVLENSFMRLRSYDLKFINHHLIPKLARIYHIPKIEVDFVKFKMADDVQAKSQAYNLMQAGYLSRKTVLEEDGYDSADEVRQMEKEHITLNSIKNSDAIADQELRNILQIMQNRNGVIAQFDGQHLQTELQKSITEENKDEVKTKLEEMAETYAFTLMSQDPALAMKTLEKMKTEMPNLHALIMQKIRAYSPKPPSQQEQVKTPPPPPQVVAEPTPVEPSVGGSIDTPLPENSMPRRAGAV